MRSVAVDKAKIPRRALLLIQETVGLPMPDGLLHDGFWYASDVGAAIKGLKPDLFSGCGRASMAPLMGLNLSTLSVRNVSEFKGCPPE
jgi:membrane-bound lytic murein transglycosylase